MSDDQNITPSASTRIERAAANLAAFAGGEMQRRGYAPKALQFNSDEHRAFCELCDTIELEIVKTLTRLLGDAAK